MSVNFFSGYHKALLVEKQKEQQTQVQGRSRLGQETLNSRLLPLSYIDSTHMQEVPETQEYDFSFQSGVHPVSLIHASPTLTSRRNLKNVNKDVHSDFVPKRRRTIGDQSELVAPVGLGFQASVGDTESQYQTIKTEPLEEGDPEEDNVQDELLNYTDPTVNKAAGKLNPIAHRMAKTLGSFGHSECSRVNEDVPNHSGSGSDKRQSGLHRSWKSTPTSPAQQHTDINSKVSEFSSSPSQTIYSTCTEFSEFDPSVSVSLGSDLLPITGIADDSIQANVGLDPIVSGVETEKGIKAETVIDEENDLEITSVVPGHMSKTQNSWSSAVVPNSVSLETVLHVSRTVVGKNRSQLQTGQKRGKFTFSGSELFLENSLICLQSQKLCH